MAPQNIRIPSRPPKPVAATAATATPATPAPPKTTTPTPTPAPPTPPAKTASRTENIAVGLIMLAAIIIWAIIGDEITEGLVPDITNTYWYPIISTILFGFIAGAIYYILVKPLFPQMESRWGGIFLALVAMLIINLINYQVHTPKPIHVSSRTTSSINEETVNYAPLQKGAILTYSLKRDEGSPWIFVPTGVMYNIHPQNNGHYRVYFSTGKIVDVGDRDIEAPFVCPAKFKVINKGEKEETFLISGF